MKANQLCPSPHLSAEDIGETGASQVFTIKAVGFSAVGQDQERKGVLYFVEEDRGMVLNRTNLKRLVVLHGNETDSWIGRRVEVYASETDFGGKTVPCLRVREKAPV